jgi:hypothetical protein
MAADHFPEIVFDSGQVHKMIEFGPEVAGTCSPRVKGAVTNPSKARESVQEPDAAFHGLDLNFDTPQIPVSRAERSDDRGSRNPGEVGPSLHCSVMSHSS